MQLPLDGINTLLEVGEHVRAGADLRVLHRAAGCTLHGLPEGLAARPWGSRG